jgi:fatty-acyl-CoA synthase
MVPSVGIGSWPARAARKAALRPAMTFQAHVITYGELADRVARLANVLRDSGVESGSRVAYLGMNHPAFLETLFATATLGAIFVPLNARLSPGEIDYMIADSGTAVLMYGGGSASTVDGLSAATRPRLIAVDGGSVDALDYAEVLAGATPARVDTPINVDDPCMIMYTSGTTGRPKGAVLTHHNIMWNCLNVVVDVDVRSDEVTLVTAPMFHTAALNMTCLPTLLKGGRLLVEPKFEAAAVIDAIEREGVTLLFGVPTMFASLTDSPRGRPQICPRFGCSCAAVHRCPNRSSPRITSEVFPSCRATA